MLDSHSRRFGHFFGLFRSDKGTFNDPAIFYTYLAGFLVYITGLIREFLQRLLCRQVEKIQLIAFTTKMAVWSFSFGVGGEDFWRWTGTENKHLLEDSGLEVDGRAERERYGGFPSNIALPTNGKGLFSTL